MKKIIVMLVIVTGIFNLNMNVYSASNPYSQYYNGNTNCTWYAWKMAYEKGGVALPAWGNANTWYESAKNAGYSVGTTPKANSIAIWTKCTDDCAKYGHVGYVERVGDDGALYIKDSSYSGMNGCPDIDDPTYKECIENGVSEETDRICLENAPRKTCAFAKDVNSPGFYNGDITQFIYLDNAPKTPVTNSGQSNSSSNNQSQKEKPKKEEVKKSNNANLKEIRLSVSEIDFSNDVTDYEIEVDNEVDLIEISAVKEDEKSNVEGVGEHQLEIGENLIELVVTAEDGTKKIYKLNIDRKEKVQIQTSEILEQEKNNKKYNIPITWVILITCILTLVGILTFIKHKKIKI